MKKILFLLPLLFFVFFPRTAIALADDSGSQSATVSPTPMATDYTLPYPGILPDNPLYVLKTLRDNIVVFFISDPLKKSEFYLLQSDKRLAASWYLLKKDTSSSNLAFSTLSKSTNYMDMAVAQERVAKTSGEDTNSLQGKITDALAKHLSVVAAMSTLPEVTPKSFLTEETGRLTGLAKVASQFSTK